MKKIIFICLMMQIFSMQLFARRGGGDAIVGALGGLAVGTMIGHASADSSGRRVTRAEEEIRRIEDRQEIRREQDKDRIERLEKGLERNFFENRIKEILPERSRTDPVVIFLIILVGFLAVAVIGLGLIVLRRRP